MNIKDVMIGVAIAWIGFTPKGRELTDNVMTEILSKYFPK
jgi:hypothetical protein